MKPPYWRTVSWLKLIRTAVMIIMTNSVFENVVTISNLPPLDQITICSESCSDNTSVCDVSSVTTDENDEMNQFFSTSSLLRKGNDRVQIHPYGPSLIDIGKRIDRRKSSRRHRNPRLNRCLPFVLKMRLPQSIPTNVHCKKVKGRRMESSTTTNPLSRRRIFQGLPPTPDLVDDSGTSSPNESTAQIPAC